MTELWVPRVSNFESHAPWKPDVPEVKVKDGLFVWTAPGCGIPTDKFNEPEKQVPLTDHLLVEVPDGQEKYVTGVVKPADVPQADKLTIQMIRDCGVEYEKNADVFFASIPNLGSGSVALKEIAKGLLEQAKARGLSDEKVETIRSQYDLPLLTSVER